MSAPTSSPTSSAAATPLPIEAEEFLTWLVIERGRAPKTIEAYRRDLSAYFAWLDRRGLGLGSANEQDLVDWLNDRRAAGRAASTIARESAAVRSFHRWVASEGMLGSDPTAGLEIPKVPMGLPKALSEAEVNALLDVIDASAPVGRRDAAMLEVLYGAGLRISEMVGLSLSDIDLDGRLLRVFGKGSKERVVPIGAMSWDALVAWFGAGGRPEMEPEAWKDRTDSEAVFLNNRGGRLSRQGAWGVVKKHGATAGLGTKLSPHVLRHSCATHMLDHGADIRIVQELLGHASITTTQIYTRVSQERLFEVHRSAHPRSTVKS